MVLRPGRRRNEMGPHGTSSTDDQIDEILRSEPPVPGASLEGWVAFSEWRKPGGETVLVLLGKPEQNYLTVLICFCYQISSLAKLLVFGDPI